MPLQNVTYFTAFSTGDHGLIDRTFDQLNESVPAIKQNWNGLNMVPLSSFITDTYHIWSTFRSARSRPAQPQDSAPGTSANWLTGTGATPVDGALTTILHDIQTGVSEGALSFFVGILPTRVYEVAKYVTKCDVGAMYVCGIAPTSRRHDRWPAAFQKAVAEAGKITTRRHVEDVSSRIAAAEKEMVDKGSIITTLADAERKRWITGLPEHRQDLGRHSGAASRACCAPISPPSARRARRRAATGIAKPPADPDLIAWAPVTPAPAPVSDSIPGDRPCRRQRHVGGSSAKRRPSPFDPSGCCSDALPPSGTVWTFRTDVLICADVIGRSFSAPITGVAEIAAIPRRHLFLQIGGDDLRKRMTPRRLPHRRHPVIARARPRLGHRGAVPADRRRGQWPSSPAGRPGGGSGPSLAAREFRRPGHSSPSRLAFRALIVLGGERGRHCLSHAVRRRDRRPAQTAGG